MLHIGYAYLLGRVIGMGLERPLVKRLGQGMNATAVTVVYLGLGLLLFLLLAAADYLREPSAYRGAEAWLLLALTPGVFHALSMHTFVKALEIGEVSVLTPLFAAGFVLMYVYDCLAGYAQLSWMPLCGVLLVALGVSSLSPAQPAGAGTRSWRRFDPRWVLRQPGATLMLINAGSFATARFFDKTFAPDAPPALYAAWVYLPAVLIGLLLLARSQQLSEITRLLALRWRLAILLALVGQGAFILALLALDYFPPSVVEPVTQLNVFIAVALGSAWFGERVRTRWLPSALVIAGAMLLLIKPPAG